MDIITHSTLTMVKSSVSERTYGDLIAIMHTANADNKFYGGYLDDHRINQSVGSIKVQPVQTAQPNVISVYNNSQRQHTDIHTRARNATFQHTPQNQQKSHAMED